MAVVLLLLKPPTHLLRRRPQTPSRPFRYTPIACGPRSNRGPLLRGRTLSTEAILAIQALKRASFSSSPSKVDQVISTAFPRLLKPDVVAALAELQRQDHSVLALKLFLAMRHEHWSPANAGDLVLYADMIAALGRAGMGAEVDELVRDLVEESGKVGVLWEEPRKLSRVVKAVAGAGRASALKELYSGMKTARCVGDEYLFRTLSRGFSGLGEEEAAAEVERDCKVWLEGGGRLEPVAIR